MTKASLSMIRNVRIFNRVVKMSRTRGRARCTLHERNDPKTRRRASRRNDERTRGTFLSPTRSLLLPASSSLLCLGRCLLGLILLLREITKKQRSRREEGALRARARERETIPVEEGPFCPAHPTRGFRRPWSH